MSRQRIAVALLSLSAAALVGTAVEENFVGQAMVPTKGDRPTIGFGSTIYEDGRPVKLGDTITPVRALVLMQNHVAKEEKKFQASLVGASLHQAEYDVYMDFVYQYGMGNWQQSSMRRELLAGNYRAACDALLRYRYAAGYDCSTPGNKRCYGVWKRQLERHQKCMGVQ